MFEDSRPRPPERESSIERHYLRLARFLAGKDTLIWWFHKHLVTLARYGSQPDGYYLGVVWLAFKHTRVLTQVWLAGLRSEIDLGELQSITPLTPSLWYRHGDVSVIVAVHYPTSRGASPRLDQLI